MRYTIEYGSDTQTVGTIKSNSRDTRKHGQELLGTAGGGWVRAHHGNCILSEACYTPEMGGYWYNASS